MNSFKASFIAISPSSVETLADRFYEHFDGALVERAGQIIVSVYLESADRVTASLQAVQTLSGLDLCVVRIDHDLVDGPEVAARLGVSRQAVNQWALGTRGDGFPHPSGTPGGKRIWAWTEVLQWAHGQGRLTDEPPVLTLDESAVLDAYLAQRRVAARGGTVSVSFGLLGGHTKDQRGVTGVDDYRGHSMQLLVSS